MRQFEPITKEIEIISINNETQNTDIANNRNKRTRILFKRNFLEWQLRHAKLYPKQFVWLVESHGYASDLYHKNEEMSGKERFLYKKNDCKQLKHEFVQYLESNFINSEMILIDYIIKQSNMNNVFKKMNDDVKCCILKMLHPLNITKWNLSDLMKFMNCLFGCLKNQY